MAKTNYDKKYIDHMNPFCTNCSADLTLQKGFEDTLKAWICEECGAALTGPAMDIEDMRFPGVVQICDDCGAILNNQPGFTDYEDFWTCTKCGTVVPIGEDDNFSSEESRKFISDGEAEGSMTVKEARMIEQEFYDNRNPSEDDEFLYVEAMDFLITEENDPQDMMNLGGYYYEQRRFELARKYYEMASAFDIDAADECLGYIWYYGRTGEKDYKKAYEHYSRSMKRGNPVSTYKIADMYKNGYYVEKDYEKYVSIIEELFPKMQKATNLGDPVPEVFTRLARIRKEQEEYEEAVDLYFYAKDFLAQRIRYNAFFGNLNIMKWLIDDLYEMIEFDDVDFDFYDLYYLLKNPVKLRFRFADEEQQVEAVKEADGIAVKFNGKWYRDRDEFFKKASIRGERLTSIYDRLQHFHIVR